MHVLRRHVHVERARARMGADDPDGLGRKDARGVRAVEPRRAADLGTGRPREVRPHVAAARVRVIEEVVVARLVVPEERVETFVRCDQLKCYYEKYAFMTDAPLY